MSVHGEVQPFVGRTKTVQEQSASNVVHGEVVHLLRD